MIGIEPRANYMNWEPLLAALIAYAIIVYLIKGANLRAAIEQLKRDLRRD